MGNDTADDAAVYKVSDELAIVTTADFFTPIVDDPFDFGRIAAANALSDLYAMGGTPMTALSLVAFPLEQLGGGVLREILRGGAAVAADGGIPIVGGHSIDDTEPKYGLSVTGRCIRTGRSQLDGAGRRRPLPHQAVGGGASHDGRQARTPRTGSSRQSRVMTTLNRAPRPRVASARAR